MSTPAVTLLTYLGHYLLARLLYDDLVRPLARGDVSVALLLAAGTGLGYALGRRSRWHAPGAGRRIREAGRRA